ncbi:histidine kinase [Amycolatopsis sp. PS_44_ISF1]|uniref:sensor histidine kinase n=1 Tax=Amycolatopsis sp. PS_44_ISF1 TaxID=2974917 RepID=UPI0028DF185C|nr:histidine kinase [Amycolatopsis sp. PS_44_ISF1]MDT8910345.1 histidine kinase [Amycolatopsis sp. PS_44_ISF1]
MDVVSAFPYAQVVPWVFVGLLAVVVLVLVFRVRRPKGVIQDAVLQAVHRMSKATPNLRAGLDEEAADRMAAELLEVLDCLAVGITDSEGTLLSWAGEATEHYFDLVEDIGTALRKHRRAVADHNKMPCNHRGTCKMKTAAIVPILVEGEAEATLIVVGRTRGKLVQMAEAVGQFVCTQFELARLEESRNQLQQAEIKALRAQISPHFVYNALNTISALIRTDPEEARELLQDFADFTRYSFRTSGMYTTLAEELRNIDRYLTIENARFGGRLEVRMKIAPEVLSVVVPFLIIQPLVENAVKHGLASKPSGGCVTVIAHDYGMEAVISVEDDGIGMDPRQLTDLKNAHRTGAHVGLGNINQRMRQVFGEDYALTVDTALGAGMKVTLRVPKFKLGVRPNMPDYSADVPPQADAEDAVEPNGVNGSRSGMLPAL